MNLNITLLKRLSLVLPVVSSLATAGRSTQAMRSCCVIKAVLLTCVLCITLTEIAKENEPCDGESTAVQRTAGEGGSCSPGVFSISTWMLFSHCGFSVENSESLCAVMSVCLFLPPHLHNNSYFKESQAAESRAWR